MMITMTADPITDKQLNFLRSLAADRDWTNIPDAGLIRVIKIVTRPDEDGNLTAPVAKKAASTVIDALLKSPKIGNTGSSTPLSGKAAAQAAIADMPASYKGLKYAIKNTDPKAVNTWIFYEIKEYKGAKYINRLQGSPGDWNKQFVKYADYAGIAQRIKDAVYVPADTGEYLAGPMAAAARFSDTWQVCSACGAKLSNGKSLADKFGPVCVKKF